MSTGLAPGGAAAATGSGTPAPLLRVSTVPPSRPLARSSGKEAAAAAKAILAEVPLERLYFVQGGADAWQVGLWDAGAILCFDCTNRALAGYPANQRQGPALVQLCIGCPPR
jgi:hypothetical protein